MDRRDTCTKFWWGKHLGDPGVDGRIILSWIFRKWDVELWLRIGAASGHL